MIVDLKAKEVDWPQYLPGAQMAVNNLPSPSLEELSPKDIIFGTSKVDFLMLLL